MQVTPRTATINEEEAGLANALVISVGGTRSLIGPDQVRAHLGRFFQVQEQDVSVRRYGEEDFNMIYRVQDKNNGELHRQRMGQFH
jgi:hypothetical protein